MTTHLLIAAVALIVSVAGSACGAGAVGDCSNGTFDGHGGCIPNSHAPRAVEAVAIRHFRGQTVDRVGCYVQREFRAGAATIKVWGCWRVADGILTHDLACVAAIGVQLLTPAVRAQVPVRKLRCTT
jgi:hypothetical protein